MHMLKIVPFSHQIAFQYTLDTPNTVLDKANQCPSQPNRLYSV